MFTLAHEDVVGVQQDRARCGSQIIWRAGTQARGLVFNVDVDILRQQRRRRRRRQRRSRAKVSFAACHGFTNECFFKQKDFPTPHFYEALVIR